MTDNNELNNNLPTPHDVFFKANLAEKRKAKALLKQIYSKELLSKLDLKHFKQVPTEFIQHNLRKVVGDVLYMTKLDGKDVYLYFLFEHQSSSDELMSFRLLLYVIQIMQQHLQQGYSKLPIILPAVIYHGKESPYPYSTSIFDCFEDKEIAKEYMFKSFNLLDLTVMSDDDLGQFDANLVFEYMLKHSRDNLADKLIEWLLQYPQQAIYFITSGNNLLNQVFSYIESRNDIDSEAIDKLIGVINENTGGEFMNYLERREQKAEQQGMQQGAVLKAQDTARNLLGMGLLSNEQIAQATNLDLDTVLKLKKEIGTKTKH
ncbi:MULTISPECIES: Rpn family recombination-promoting nuclease/putative transposase [Cysteiniphilum]|uniref:Rpn family recombination-promoting nuclease/putative transposase n=1 Tax=Cysteiniphilum TaxID=2056696 RepID=UPI00177DABD5|nr:MULTISPECIES: Rpn family recombination-promoting nuclease/putative transposase [Cysteiniphilum]